MIRGYHEYKAIWEDPVNGKSLVCEREVGNSHDPLSVAVKKMISGASTILGMFLEGYFCCVLFFLDEEEPSIV